MKYFIQGFPGGSDGKESACNAEDLGSSPGLGRSEGGGKGNLLQYPCLENPMNRGAWRAIVHGVTKSWTQLSTHALCAGHCAKPFTCIILSGLFNDTER